MLENYFPILIFILFSIVLSLILLFLGKFLAPHKPNPEKDSPYECGFEVFSDSRAKFDVRYYLIAILFILFDLEIAFLVPWAVVFKSMNWTVFWAMMIFLIVLTIGFAYEWRKGALEWE